ncbi:hypothetical protein ACYX34_04125 [Nitrospira sp. CMX1]
MHLTNGVNKASDAVLPWGVENDFLRKVSLKILMETSAPARVYFGELSGVDYCMRQCLLSLWLSQGVRVSRASLTTLCVRWCKLDPRTFDQRVDRSHGMTT